MKAFLGAMALFAIGAIGADVPLCGTAFAAACCKICKKGKACGDSCISAEKTCHQPSGCACNG